MPIDYFFALGVMPKTMPSSSYFTGFAARPGTRAYSLEPCSFYTKIPLSANKIYDFLSLNRWVQKQIRPLCGGPIRVTHHVHPQQASPLPGSSPLHTTTPASSPHHTKVSYPPPPPAHPTIQPTNKLTPSVTPQHHNLLRRLEQHRR